MPAHAAARAGAARVCCDLARPGVVQPARADLVGRRRAPARSASRVMFTRCSNRRIAAHNVAIDLARRRPVRQRVARWIRMAHEATEALAGVPGAVRCSGPPHCRTRERYQLAYGIRSSETFRLGLTPASAPAVTSRRQRLSGTSSRRACRLARGQLFQQAGRSRSAGTRSIDVDVRQRRARHGRVAGLRRGPAPRSVPPHGLDRLQACRPVVQLAAHQHTRPTAAAVRHGGRFGTARRSPGRQKFSYAPRAERTKPRP